MIKNAKYFVFKKLYLFMIAMLLFGDLSIFPQDVSAKIQLNNPQIVQDSNMFSGQKVTWDCVYFGSYPQAEVISSSMTYDAIDNSMLKDGDIIVSDSVYKILENSTDWNTYEDTSEIVPDDIIIDGIKYCRVKTEDYSTDTEKGDVNNYYWSDSITYRYFKYEPVKWRVLDVSENEALLLSDVALDCRNYDVVYVCTWGKSTMRSWLNGYSGTENYLGRDYSNGNFINTVFSAAKIAAINPSYLENKDSLVYGTDGGSNTSDKIFLLSESETYTDNAIGYGFTSSYETYDEARWCKSSTFAKAMGSTMATFPSFIWEDYPSIMEKCAGNCDWFLRSPGNDEESAATVEASGDIYLVGRSINRSIRPALRLNLSYTDVYYYAGTVCSDGTVISVEPPIEKETNSTQTSTEQYTSKNNSESGLKLSKTPKTTKIKKIKSSKKLLKVSWKKVNKVNGYQLQYSTSKKFKKTKKLTIKKAKTTSKTIKKLKAKKKYYVRIRTYIIVKGKKYYSDWSKVKSKKTK